MGTIVLLDLMGGVALLLWGLHMVESGIVRAFGSDLRRVLLKALSNRFAAFGVGAGLTALLQSSTATGLMTASFAAKGMIGLVPALAIMLGANVGTTLIVQVLSFNITAVAPALFVIGLVAFRSGARNRIKDLGRVAIGMGQNRLRDRCRKRGGHGGTDDCPDRRARGDESEQALALLGREDVDHHGPEDRDHEQVEHRSPDEEEAADPHRLLRRRKVQGCAEDQDRHGKETIGQWNELPARQHLHQRRKRDVQHDHDDERTGEQPLQIVDSARDPHLVADRPQDVVGGKDRRDIEPAPAERRQLAEGARSRPIHEQRSLVLGRKVHRVPSEQF